MLQPLPAPRNLKALLDRHNVQIQAWDMLDSQTRKALEDGQGQAILMRGGETLLGHIRQHGAQAIFASGLAPGVALRSGERVLVVVPSPEGQRYVIQTTVAGLVGDGVDLRIEDPRLDRRCALSKAAPVLFWPVPGATVQAMQGGDLALMRDTGIAESVASATATRGSRFSRTSSVNLGQLLDKAPRRNGTWQVSEKPTDGTRLARVAPSPRKDNPVTNSKENPGQNLVEVVDYLSNPGSEEPTGQYHGLLLVPGHHGEVLDVSLGGMQMRVHGMPGPGSWDSLLYVGFRLDVPPRTVVTVMTFAVVRHARRSVDGALWHLMFLVPLPRGAQTYLDAAAHPARER